jgi:lipoyl(octanoyl) transferase
MSAAATAATVRLSDEASPTRATPLLRHLGLASYEPVWRAMQRFTDERDGDTRDEIWFVEHPPVFTLGLNASREHLLAPGDIPVVQIDRGGQVTYHGPGQLVIYPLIDIRRRGLGVRQLVVALENAIIDTVAEFGVVAAGRRDAPGVYVNGAKLASVGLRIRRGASYHGVALNVSLDLEPFSRINVCGYRGLAVTRLVDLCAGVSAMAGSPAGRGGAVDMARVMDAATSHLLRHLGFEPPC